LPEEQVFFLDERFVVANSARGGRHAHHAATKAVAREL